MDMDTPIAEEPHTSHPHFVRRNSSLWTRKRQSILPKIRAVRNLKETNWFLEAFKKKDCCRFVPAKKNIADEETLKCKCGRIQKSHTCLIPSSPSGNFVEKWKSSTSTRVSSTDAYGELEFRRKWTTRSKYIRVSDDVHSRDLYQLLTRKWGLEHPTFLIEVTEGDKTFKMQPQLRRIFQHGIIKVASHTNAWILTGGINTDVIGEALQEHCTLRSRHRIVTIGVAPWGVVDHRMKLINKGQTVNYPLISSLNNKDASLEPNHTHLVLVDDGTEGQPGSDIQVRSNFMKYVQQIDGYAGDTEFDRSTPTVCVVLGGGLNTINKVVLKNISSVPVIPCVVVKGSGGGADLMAYAYENADQNGKLSEDCIVDLQRKIEETYPKHKDKHANVLRGLRKIATKKDLLTVYSVDGEGGIDHAILHALHKANKPGLPQQLRLALNWNRVDIAEDIFRQTAKWDKGILSDCFEIALSFNQVKFAGLLMECGIEVGTFLTKDKLETLYNPKVPVYQDFQDREEHSMLPAVNEATDVNPDKQVFQEDKLCPSLSSMFEAADMKPPEPGNITLEGIAKLVTYLLGHGLQPFGTKEDGAVELFHGDNDSDKRQLCINHLFIWALLTKKFDMAFLMWKRGRESIAKALIGNRMCSRMCEIAGKGFNTNAVSQLSEERRRYERLAFDLLDNCYYKNNTYTQFLLRAQLSKWNHHTCLTLGGAAFELTRFIAHPAIQLLLNDHWLGRLATVTDPVQFQKKMKEEKHKISSFPCPNVSGFDPGDKIEMRATSRIKQARDDGKDEDSNEQAHRPPMWELGYYRNPKTMFFMERLSNAPVVRFVLDTVSYSIFLALFTYVVFISRHPVSVVELVVALFIISFVVEEVRQILFPDKAKYNLPIKTKLQEYLFDFWNVLDVIGIITFLCGFGLRVADYFEDGDHRIIISARIFYCVSMMVWYIRLLVKLSVFEPIGPYVYLVFKMGQDAWPIGILAIVFILSYGLVRGALLHPNDQIFNTLAIPYWQIYGELFLESDGRLVCGDYPCESEANFVYVALCIHLLIGNVVLLNILIATFNVSIAKAKEDADEIWKYQRYHLTMVYSNRSLFPPPFILLAHIWLFFKFMKRRCSKDEVPHAMDMCFGEPSTQLLYDFEKTRMEDYLKKQDIEKQDSMEGIIQRIAERIDTLALTTNTMVEKQKSIQDRYEPVCLQNETVETVT